uniref:U6 snRNA-associated Sm-like protein LSm6 n=1 Tax=Gasterosteus aculeatus aculeatus TaxID=481459 RepID=G3PYQ5_GASAC
MSLRKQTPSDFLKQIIGRPVVVKLNSGVDYRGVLACLDGYMNIAIEQTEEYVNGQLKNKYGDAFLRGNNVLYISTQKRKAYCRAAQGSKNKRWLPKCMVKAGQVGRSRDLSLARRPLLVDSGNYGYC